MWAVGGVIATELPSPSNSPGLAAEASKKRSRLVEQVGVAPKLPKVAPQSGAGDSAEERGEPEDVKQAPATSEGPTSQPETGVVSSKPKAKGRPLTRKTRKVQCDADQPLVGVEHEEPRSSAGAGEDSDVCQTAFKVEGTPNIRVSSKITGANAHVTLLQHLPQPPRGLFPKDARVTRVRNKKPQQFHAKHYSDTVAEAKAAGLAAPEPWPGLGEIPECLRKGFKSLLILGPSGSGKSTLLRALLAELHPEYKGPLYPVGNWRPGRAVIEAFPSAQLGSRLLGFVGLSSIPSWCKPFEVLSTSERYRANIAQALQQRSVTPGLPLVFDEWTSELNRSLARVVSVSLGKYLRRSADGTLGTAETLSEQDPLAGTPSGVVTVDGGCETATDADVEFEEDTAEEAIANDMDQDPPSTAMEEDFPRTVLAPRGEQHSQEDLADEADEAFTQYSWSEVSGGHEAPSSAEDTEEGGDALEVCTALMAALKDPPPPPPEEHEEAKKGEQPGPFIFATSHEDVASYLQTEFVCICAVGEPPRAFRNNRAGAALQLHSKLRGDVSPLPMHEGGHLLVGHWHTIKEEQEFKPFMIKYKSRPDVYNLRCEGGRHVESLRRSAGKSPKGVGSAWYCGILAPVNSELRVRAVNVNILVVQLREPASKMWSKEIRMKRRRLPQPLQALMLARTPAHAAKEKYVPNYSDFDLEVLQSHGWYVPPDLVPEQRYKGMELQGEPLLVSKQDFHYDTFFERKDDSQRYLATYVGEPDGGLCEKLVKVSRLLDCPFDGLCVHRVPQLPPLGDFCVGVITGPSGSGKSTLARHMFGPSATVSWLPSVPVLGHFTSLAGARELFEATALELNAAMRPYDELSRGEQSRADLARLLQRVVVAADTEGTHALVLDEFTSLVDRSLARRLARGVQRLARRRGLRRIVAVSCHDDFVGSGLMEPDWLFECHNGRLLRFVSSEAIAVTKAEAPKRQELQVQQDALQEAEQQVEELQERLSACAAAGCLSDTFRTEVRVLGQALSSLGDQELRRRRAQVAEADEQVSRAREAAQEAFRASLNDGLGEDEEVQDDPAPSPQPSLAVPKLELEIRRALPREWLHFREHHYKDHGLHTCSVVFVGLLDNSAAAFLAVVAEKVNFVQRNATRTEWAEIGYPEPWASGKPRRLYREHRTVVLPDFQGMGLAPLFADAVALHLQRGGHDFTSQTVHPFYGGYRDRSPFWRPLPSNRKGHSRINGNFKFSHFFVGAFRPDGKQDRRLAWELQRRAVEKR